MIGPSGTTERDYSDVGELRVSGSDARLEELRLMGSNQNAFKARVIWDNCEDLRERFAADGIHVGLGTKSCLAQLGVFGAIAQKGKTMYRDIEVTNTRIVATIKGSQYSPYPVRLEGAKRSEEGKLLKEGQEFGRFLVVAGGPCLSRNELLRLMSDNATSHRPVYDTGGEGNDEFVSEDGGLTLSARPLMYRIDPDMELEERLFVTSRRHLPDILSRHDIPPDHLMNMGDFLVTDTPGLRMPVGIDSKRTRFSGLLKVDQLGDMAQPAHLNSPIVDNAFGNGAEGPAHLRLELYHPHPHPIRLRELYVRLYFYRERIVEALAPDDGGQKKMFADSEVLGEH